MICHEMLSIFKIQKSRSVQVSALQYLCCAVGNEQDQRHKKQNQSQRTREIGGKDFPSVLAVDFGPSCKFGLVLGFESLLFVPPSAATIEVISNIRRTNDCHISPQRTRHLHRTAFPGTARMGGSGAVQARNTKVFLLKGKYSTNFLILSYSQPSHELLTKNKKKYKNLCDFT